MGKPLQNTFDNALVKLENSLVKTTGPLNKLFVYGIFLDARMRDAYSMSEPEYEVVPGYVTRQCGGSIVEAVEVPSDLRLGLTGLLVTVDPHDGKHGRNSTWKRLDILEGGYDRIIVTTESGERAWMYVAKEQ